MRLAAPNDAAGELRSAVARCFAVAARPRILALLARAIDEAHQAHPGVDVSAAEFVEFVAARTGRDDASAVAKLALADLYLACGCALSRPAALDAFESSVLRPATRSLRRLLHEAAARAEVEQLLRQKFFVGDGGRPRIVDYRGQGSLAAWVRAAAVRAALNLRRRAAALDDDLPIADARSPGQDPELDLLRREYGPDFQACFRGALDALSARERTLLRLHFVEGAGVEELARVHAVHRTTVTRWIGRCLEQLLDDVRRRLAERLRASPGEVESLLRVVKSQLPLSLRRELASREEPPGAAG